MVLITGCSWLSFVKGLAFENGRPLLDGLGVVTGLVLEKGRGVGLCFGNLFLGVAVLGLNVLEKAVRGMKSLL